MVETASTMELPLGSEAPLFNLSDPSGRRYSIEDFRYAPALLVAFICNHCPYVRHIRSRFASLAKEYQERGVAIVAINANDAENYPDDSPAKMAEEARDAGYTFPYLIDESQQVAKEYHAACTPDFFLFDGNREGKRRLVYRGQFDGARPGNQEAITGRDLRAAMDAVLEWREVPAEQRPSAGCNIKWRAAASGR